MGTGIPAGTASPLERLRAAIGERTARVCVVGLGYVGLPLARTFAEAGFPVLGFDTDPAKVRALNEGRSYLAPVPPEVVRALREEGRLEATSDAARFAEADAILICVPTPLTAAREPDLSYVVGTAEAVAEHLRPGHLVVLESTTYPGTTDEVLRPILERGGLRAEHDFLLAYSPEREDPGNPDHTTRTIPKLVGGTGPRATEVACLLYGAAVERVVPVSDARTAEAAKILENTYRAVNIALVNELKVLYDRMGIDVWEVIDAARTKPFGFQAFYPGPGLGGHCLPIDPFYLTWIARRHGLDTQFIELAGRINTAMPGYVTGRLAAALNERGRALKDSRVLVLGIAYKRDVDDTRESPAFVIMADLLRAGARVAFHDPFFEALPPKRAFDLEVPRARLTPEVLAEQDAVVIVTDHSTYDYAWLVEHAPLVLDTRGATRHLGSPPNVVRA